MPIFLRDGIGCFKPDAKRIVGQAVGVFARRRDCIVAIFTRDAHSLRNGNAVAGQAGDDGTHVHVFSVAAGNLLRRLVPDTGNLRQAVRVVF